jgi:DNA-binding XRE family transcriptional regulator
MQVKRRSNFFFGLGTSYLMVEYGYLSLYLPTNSHLLPTAMDNEYLTNQSIMLHLAKRVKEYRLAARISQKDMAEKSGVGQATISHFEQGVNPNMTLNNFISLLRAVGMEQRIMELLPELPMHPMTLREINKRIPKRVRRKDNDTKS